MSEQCSTTRNITVTVNAVDLPGVKEKIDELKQQIRHKDEYIKELEEEVAALEGKVREQPENLKDVVTQFIKMTLKLSNDPAALAITPELIKVLVQDGYKLSKVT